MFCKKGVLKNCAKFTEKQLCQRLFFNKVAGVRPATLLKRVSGTSFDHLPSYQTPIAK